MSTKACELCNLSEVSNKVCMMGQKFTDDKPSCGKKIMVLSDFVTNEVAVANNYMSRYNRKLWSVIFEDLDISMKDVYFTSVVKCSTMSDEVPPASSVKACMNYFLAELDIIQPDIIIPTGNISCKVLGLGTSITKANGKKVTTKKIGLAENNIREYDAFPMISPSMISRQPKYLEQFLKSAESLQKILNGEIEYNTDGYLYGDEFDVAVKELNRFIALPSGTSVTFDLETTKTNPYVDKVIGYSDNVPEYYRTPRILGLGLSDREKYGFAVPLDHLDNKMTEEQKNIIKDLIAKLFRRKDLEFTAHNGKFDQKWLERHIKVAPYLTWDTMLMHYLAVTEEKGTHGLKELAWKYTDMGGYDDILDEVKPTGIDEGNYGLIAWDILKVYLAGDVDCTMRILNILKPLVLGNPEFKWLYENLMREGSECLRDIETNGAYVDMELYQEMKKEYEAERDRLYESLYQCPEVIQIEREWQEMWAERCAIGKIPKSNRTDEQQEKFTKWKRFDPKNGGDKFNFSSINQLRELLFNRLGLTTHVYTEKGELSTNDESLNLMKGQHYLCDLLLEYRKVNHLYNNFIAPMEDMVDSDSLVHCTYNIIGTETGRLSSSNPNHQQLPRKTNVPTLFQYQNEIKGLYKSRFGEDGVILQSD